MGSPPEEEGREPEYERAHERLIVRSIAVSTTEVTFDQFHEFQSERRQQDRHAKSPRCPVNGVTWYEAAAYCNWLTGKDKKLSKDDCVYAENIRPGMKLFPDALERHGYRLPTEAEMEYFSRASTTTSRPFGESDELLPRFSWTWLNSGDQLHPVAMLLPNELGLFDVLGNAYEWCHDGQHDNFKIAYTPYPDGSIDNPAGDPDERRPTLDNDTWRFMRGGAFCFAPASSRSAARYTVYVTMNLPYTGFRVVRTLPDKSR
jgi:eukaryotic-like serine/threonine-protein kinase